MTPVPEKRSPRWSLAVALLAVVGFGLIMFNELLAPGRLLFTTDNNIGQTAMMSRALPGAILGVGWWDGELLGQPIVLNPSLTSVLLWLLPLDFAHNWIRLIHLGLASVFFLLFLREHRRSWSAAVFGTVVAFWIGQFTIFSYAGHLGKSGALVFASGFLWATAVAARRQSLRWGALAGALLGGAFAEQADMGLLFAVGLGFYPLHAWARKYGFQWRRILVFHAAIFGVAFLLAAPSLLRGYEAAVRESAVVRGGDRAVKWEYITQWSLPPEDLLDLVAPAYHGLRTGEPEGPYWGRIGRTAGWEKTGKGFMNFRLDQPYIGMLPFMFAAFALIPAARARFRAGRPGPAIGVERVECHVLFFSLLSILMLGFALGKFSPLYRMLYLLPVINDVRAPVKFLEVFQLTLAVVAAYGLDLVFRSLPDYWAEHEFKPGGGEDRARIMPAWMRAFPWVWLGIGGICAIAAFSLSSQHAAQMPLWSARWGSADIVNIIWSHRVTGLNAAAAFSMAGALLIWIARRMHDLGRTAHALAWVVVAAVAANAYFTSRPFVHTLPRSQLVENAALRAMNDRDTLGRACLLTQDGFYNNWLSIQFPYFGMRAVNITQMPNMPKDSESFLKALSARMVRMWDLSSVTRLAGPADWLEAMAREPSMSGRMHRLLRYHVVGTPDGGVAVQEDADAGSHAVWAFTPAMARFALIHRWEAVPESDMPSRLASDEFAPGQAVLVRPEDMAALGQPAGAREGNVRVIEYRSGFARLEVRTPGPALLRFSEKINPAWKASVDGQSAPVLRVDAICIGVPVPAGEHEVVLSTH